MVGEAAEVHEHSPVPALTHRRVRVPHHDHVHVGPEPQVRPGSLPSEQVTRTRHRAAPLPQPTRHGPRRARPHDAREPARHGATQEAGEQPLPKPLVAPVAVNREDPPRADLSAPLVHDVDTERLDRRAPVEVAVSAYPHHGNSAAPRAGERVHRRAHLRIDACKAPPRVEHVPAQHERTFGERVHEPDEPCLSGVVGASEVRVG